MQIIDVVHDQNFMESYNLSAPTDTMLNDMKSLTQFDWFKNFGLTVTWKYINCVPLALIPTKYGLCFNFNIVNSSKLLKEER
jgi:hypothetical protein